MVLIANNQSILDEYTELKHLKEESNQKDNPEKLEIEIARRFGKLLSYDDDSITELMERYR